MNNLGHNPPTTTTHDVLIVPFSATTLEIAPPRLSIFLHTYIVILGHTRKKPRNAQL